MLRKLLKIVIGILCIYFVILRLNSNVMAEIGKRKVYGTNTIPEIKKYDAWEWSTNLDGMGVFWVNYRDEYLREDILFISLSFFNDTYNSNKNNDVSVGIMVNLSEADKVRMKLSVYYACKEKKLIYYPVYILQGESDDTEVYSDEKSIDEYLNKYGLTRQDVKGYQEYVIYDVVVKTWTKAYITHFYWLEKWKLKLCRVEDNTFRFEEDLF